MEEIFSQLVKANNGLKEKLASVEKEVGVVVQQYYLYTFTWAIVGGLRRLEVRIRVTYIF